ncbi:unnamed protein product [Leptosia nina]|uniref:Reverse transcriptase domain-containing protein n=1 Tax=Leptosia nina TaxID=320188 RepID=A0AAV1JQ34_9NEOP
MKSIPKKVYNLRPLPGGRRGAPGANAGCSSMRSVGDGGLNRRVPLEKNTTADEVSSQSSPSSSSLFSSIPSTNPFTNSPTHSASSNNQMMEDVVQEADLAVNFVPTTSKQRRKWSKEMNEFILRTYLRLTLMESDTNGYLPLLHTKFIEKYPEMHVISRQRIGDQRRAIISKKLLNQSEIDTIYNETRIELNNIQDSIDMQNTSNNGHQSFNDSQIERLHHTNNTCQRMRWTKDHNEAIMRAYYKVTSLESNITAYRGLLHKEFIAQFPYLTHITEQRVADQRRLIINNKYISEEKLQEIREEVRSEIIQLNNTNKEISNGRYLPAALSTSNDHILNNYEEINFEIDHDHRSTLQEIRLESIEEIDHIFGNAHKFFKDSDPTLRSYIPKQKYTKKLFSIIHYINSNILPKYVNVDSDFLTLQTALYCAAWTTAKMNGSKLKLEPCETNYKKIATKPKWQIRLERRITELRVQIGRLTQYLQGNRSKKLVAHVEIIKNSYKIHATHESPNTGLLEFLDTLKQKLNIYCNRLKRYKNCTLRKMQNKQFTCNEKLFYRELRNPKNVVNENNLNYENNRNTDSVALPDLYNYWSNIWENPVQHHSTAEWIFKEQERYSNLQHMDVQFVPIDIFQNVINKLHNWKSPGSDNIHNFWFKKYSFLHPFLHNHINMFLQIPTTLPGYITMGTTYMLPKDPHCLNNPAKYRPITCLQTIYKIITSCITELVYQHIHKNNILTEQQKGCRKHSQGCKEQLVIDSVILKQAQIQKTDLYTMYIDYKKAFDSVPHTWLLNILEIYKVHPTIVQFLKHTMTQWTTRLKLTNNTNIVLTDPIKIQRGIFQGDSLSPLWFCLALNPLSNLLNTTSGGYTLFYTGNCERTLQIDKRNFKLNHLMYMDDIKLYGATEEELKTLAQTTEMFSQDINMEFGTDKCKVNSFKGGEHIQHQYYLQSGDIIAALRSNEVYKYLGYIQARQIEHKEIKASLIKEYKYRLNSILRSQLYSKNTTKAINTYAIPVLTYSFGIINWSKSELISLQRLINTTMTRHRKHHPRSCVQRLTLPRSEGGRGLIDLINLHNKQITSLRYYFKNKSKVSTMHQSIAQNDKKLTPLNLNDEENQKNEAQTDKQTKFRDWLRKSLHGRHLRDLNHTGIDTKASNEFLRRGELFPETEGFILAIQDQVLETRNYQKHIMKLPSLIEDSCRKCKGAPETIQHITGSCRVIAQTDYKHRHDQVAAVIHQIIAFNHKLIPEKVPYYKYSPQTVLDTKDYKLYWDRTILTDKTIHYNRPDITFHDKRRQLVYLIDIAVPNTHNISPTYSEKLNKYIDLSVEIKSQWKVKLVKTIPIIISSTGIIPQTLHTSLAQLNIHPLTYVTLQKAAILNTCRIVRKFLNTDSTTTITLG